MTESAVVSQYTPLNNSIHTADELSTKLPVTDLNIATQRDADSNLHRYKDIQDFLINHIVKKGENKVITNTRIGDKTSNIHGGSYHIPDEEQSTFLKLYYRDIIAPKKKEYLTEKQRDKDGPILIDIDLRHDYEVDERQYSKENVEDMLDIYLDEINNIFQLEENTKFPVFIFQKPTVNQLKEKKITKDGIHIIIGIQADHTIQQILRNKVMQKVKDVWESLPIINTWEDVFDKGISAGTTNWQLFGSRKPNHDKYMLTYIYNVGFDSVDGGIQRVEQSLSSFDICKNMHLLSVRYKGHASLFMKNSFINEYENYNKNLGGGSGSTVSSSSCGRKQITLDFGSYDIVNLIKQIKNQEELDALLAHFLDNLTSAEHELRDAYEYAMILPSSYYEQGSYSKWTRLCWALRNTSNKLLIVFVKVSSKASNFHYATSIPEICDRWMNTDIKHSNGLTKRSLINWAKTDAPKDEYEKVKSNSIDTFVEETIRQSATKKDDRSSGCGDFDLANVLYQHNKDLYVCASVKSNIWYEFKKNRWQEIDSGTTLRKKISIEMRKLYEDKSKDTSRNARIAVEANNSSLDDAEENSNEDGKKQVDLLKNRIKAIQSIEQRLSKTNDKKNIMTEAKELFYDGSFLQKLDMNPYLICFNNGVFDFKEKIFRNGHPEDNVSMCTNIDYIQLTDVHQPTIDKINDFMNKLFPEKELCDYMWDHLASCMIGTSLNQTFNIYIGIGQNGKSVLINLMEKVLGDYKGDVPLTLVTDKRGKVGGLAPEIVQLKGKRLAVMQEPSKGDKINEGIMKQLTSGKDPIQGRAPYMPMTISFIPQFNLVVTANVFMKIESNDHGTWRRIRPVPFMSLFTENPVKDDPEKPYQFHIDKNIDEEFDDWKEVFASMLIDHCCKTNGLVKDCAIVMAKNAEYRKSQDYLSEFIQDRLIRDKMGVVKKTDLNLEFTLWYTNNYGGKGPSPKDLHEQMNKEFGRQKNSSWYGVKILYNKNAGERNDDDTTIDEDDIDDGDL